MGGIPLLPHHTQVVAMMMMAKFFETKDKWKGKGFDGLIMQMKTGEGKSIVIAMMAVLLAAVIALAVRRDPRLRNRIAGAVKWRVEGVAVYERNS